VATTARRHGYGRLRRGANRSRYGRLHPGRVGRGLYRGTGRSKGVVFRLRRGRVAFLAVADRGLAAHGRALRSYIRLAHL
jgi:hypothetical protein